MTRAAFGFGDYTAAELKSTGAYCNAWFGGNIYSLRCGEDSATASPGLCKGT